MNVECGLRRVNVKPGPVLAYSCRKAIKGPPGLTFLFDGRIATYITSYALRKDRDLAKLYLE